MAPPLRHWNFLKQIEHLIKYEQAGDDMETVVLRAVKLKNSCLHHITLRSHFVHPLRALAI